MADVLEHFAAARPPRGQEQCACCEGDGTHSSRTCARCDGSGFVRAGSDDPFCPGREDDRPAPKRRHWRQGSRETMSVEELLNLHSDEALRRERHRTGDQYTRHGDATRVRTLYDRKAAEMAGNPDWHKLDEPIRHGTIDPVLLATTGDGHTVVSEGGHRIVRAHQLGVMHLPVSWDPGSQAHRYDWEEPEPMQHEAAGPGDYGIGHRPMEHGAPVHDLTGESPGADFDRTSYWGEDYLTHPQYFSDTSPPSRDDHEALAQMRRVQGKPDAPVHIYRATHQSAPHEINPGDWVTLSKSYAAKHAWAESGSDDPEAQYAVHHAVVPARHVRDAGSGGYREQGYWGPPVACCGHQKQASVRLAMTHDELAAHLENWFHPVQEEADRTTHPRSGYEVETGEERRVHHPERTSHGNESLGTEGPAQYEVYDHGDPHAPGHNSLLYPKHVRSEPIPHVYRGVSEAELHQARERGYIQSDKRGTISPLEGTNAASDPRSAFSYLPHGGRGHLLKIRVHPDEHWFTIHADNYLRTRHPIPFSRVEAISPVVEKDPKYGHASLPEGEQRIAGLQGNLPELAYYHVRQGREKGGYHAVAAAHEGQIIGHLTWGPGDTRIRQLWVHPQYRRQGVADAIHARARWVEPGLEHHRDRTEAGEAWARAADGDVPERLYDTTSADAERKGAWTARQFQDRLDSGHPTMQRLAARHLGGNPDEYGMSMRPDETADQLHDLGGHGTFPKDVYETLHHYDPGGYNVENYGTGHLSAIRRARGNPEKKIRIYRAAPAQNPESRNAKKGEINNGDWITLNKKYADQEARGVNEPSEHGFRDANHPERYHIWSALVPAKHIRSGGGDLMEWGYHGPDVKDLPHVSERCSHRNPFTKRERAPARRSFWDTDYSGKGHFGARTPERWYHGTAKYWRPGDLIHPGGGGSGKPYAESSPDHVYLTRDPGLAARYSGMRDNPQPEHTRDDRYSVYEVEPTGETEPDPQHSGEVEGYDAEPNYRSRHPLRVVRRMPYTHQQIRDAEIPIRHEAVLPMSGMHEPDPVLNSLNPTGGMFVRYDPQSRASAPLGPNMTTLAETRGVHPDTPVRLYRGAPPGQASIVPGDFVTDNPQLARHYAGEGRVLSLDAAHGDVLDDRTEPGGGEYIYRPREKSGPPGHTAALEPPTALTDYSGKQHFGGTKTAVPLPHSQLKLFHMEHEPGPSHPEPGSVTLWRGLHLGDGDAREAESLHHDPAAALYRKGPAGIHWTDNETSAWRFAHGRDAEGWREDPEWSGKTHSMGVILHGQVHPRHILQEGSQELEDYRDVHAILHEDHPEQEVTVRSHAPIHVSGITATTVGPDGEERETYHPYGYRHLAALDMQQKLFDMPHTRPVPAHEARPWYHGTRYRFRPGARLEGGKVNMNQGFGGIPGEHVYYSGRPDIAAEFAEAASGPEPHFNARPRVYQVQPDESHEADPLEEPEADSWRAGHVRVVKEVPWEQARRGRIAVFVPSERIFGPTYGLDHRLFDESEHLRPAVRDTIMSRLGGVLEQVLGPDWHLVTTAWLAGSQASKWTSPQLEGNGDLDVLIGLSHSHARRVAPKLGKMTDEEIERHLNRVLRERFNAPGWHPPFDPDGSYDLTGYAIHAADIRALQPYAAYDLSSNDWTVQPPDLPQWSAEQFPQGPALMQQARALIAEVRAILRLPEPFRRQEAERIWHYIHEGRAQAFGEGGLGWQGTGNVLEKALDQASGALVGRLKDVIYGPDDGHPQALGQGMTTTDLAGARA